MYRILIVDDEKWIRLGVEAKLHALFPGRFMIETAASATGAASLLEKAAYELLITDIRMPGMDGIELVQAARRCRPDIQAVIISGYADFAYAEQALNMGVLRYLLKPIQDEALMAAVEKAAERIEENRRNKGLLDEIRVAEADKEDRWIERQLNQLLQSDERAENLQLGELERRFPPKRYYALIIINIDYNTYRRGGETSFEYQYVELIRYGVKNIVSEYAAQYGFLPAYAFDNLKNGNQVFLLISLEDRGALEELGGRCLIKICESVQKSMKISATFAMSGCSRGIVPRLYREARECIDLRLLRGTEKFYRFNDVPFSGEAYYPAERMSLLKKSMERKDYANIRPLLNDIFSPGNFPSLAHARILYSDVVNTLLKVCIGLSIPTDRLIDSGIMGDDVFNSFDKLEEVVAVLFSVIRKALNQEEFPDIRGEEFNRKVIEYIDRNYPQNLTANKLATHFAVSPNYFSNLFSKNNYMPFTRYLMNVRILKACELLQNTGTSIEHIAESVGFNDPRYFYRVFKRVMGCTPKEYRIE